MAAKRHARSTGIHLNEIDYLRLVQARSRIDAAMLSGEHAIREAVNASEQTVQSAREAFVTLFDVTAKKYRFDPRVSYQFDDARCVLHAEKTPSVSS